MSSTSQIQTRFRRARVVVRGLRQIRPRSRGLSNTVPSPTRARSVTSRVVFPPLPSSKPGPTAPYSRSPIDDAYLSSGRPDVDVSHRGWVKLRWHGGSFFASSSSAPSSPLADSSAPSGRLPRPQTGLGKGGSRRRRLALEKSSRNPVLGVRGEILFFTGFVLSVQDPRSLRTPQIRRRERKREKNSFAGRAQLAGQ